MNYPGGKGKCYQHLINLMPPHETYIESHLGGGAVLRHKRPALHNIGIDRDPSVIQWWRANSPHLCELVEADASAYLQLFSYSGNELVYADPPYPIETRRRKHIYRCEYATADHQHLLNVLCALPCMTMISSYDNDLYNDILTGWRKVTFRAKTHSDIRQECVWLNFPPAQQLHDVRFLGHTFRERQTVKRRNERLRKRIQSLDPIERYELIHWLQETYQVRRG